jgi:hypothetical protein
VLLCLFLAALVAYIVIRQRERQEAGPSAHVSASAA